MKDESRPPEHKHVFCFGVGAGERPRWTGDAVFLNPRRRVSRPQSPVSTGSAAEQRVGRERG